MNAQAEKIDLLQLNEGGHSPMGASSFSRRALCPASLQMEAGKHDTPSEYALEGTAAHWVAEQALLNRGFASDYIGEVCPEAPNIAIDEPPRP